MSSEEPTILYLRHTAARTTTGNDTNPIVVNSIAAKLSDGKWVDLFGVKPGDIEVCDEDLRGKTVAQAREYAASKSTGPILFNSLKEIF